MKNTFERALADPNDFMSSMSELSSRFSSYISKERYDLKDIRAFVMARNDQLANEIETLRAVLGAFAWLITNSHAQSLRVKGIFKQTLMVESSGFQCEFLDLFYRCVFEGLDLSQEGEV